MTDVSQLGFFKAPFSRYDLYCILSLLSLAIITISLGFAGLIMSKKYFSQDNFFEKSLKHNNFFKICKKSFTDGLKANKKNKDYNSHHNFDQLVFAPDDVSKIKISISVINNTKKKDLKECHNATGVSEYLNNHIHSTSFNGAKCLLIGPNQVGKSYTAEEFSQSIEGLTFVIKIDANEFSGAQRTHHMANTLNLLQKMIKKANKESKRVNFCFIIDEFDKKSGYYGGFNMDIEVYKRKIVEDIIEPQRKPQWLINHNVITANNAKNFERTKDQEGNYHQDDKNTFLARFANIFTFNRLEIDGEHIKNSIRDIVNEINVKKKMNKSDEEINDIVNKVKDKLTIMAEDEKRGDSTFSSREISDACWECMHGFKIKSTSELDSEKQKK